MRGVSKENRIRNKCVGGKKRLRSVDSGQDEKELTGTV